MMVELSLVLAAFALSAALLRLLSLPRVAAWFLDHPNERSLHASPVPRTGGLAIMPVLLVAMVLVGGNGLVVVLAAGLTLVSLLDDWKDLPAGVRFVAHLAAAATFALASFPGANWIVLLLLILAVGWMINLYNFMDGADGLAGGMTILGFCAFAAAAWLAGDSAFAVTSLCVAACAGAFLLYNFPPARVFMGDAGSIPIGFLAAAFGLLGWRDGLWPLWFPVVAFGPFIFDSSVTLLRRGVRGERIWEAHRSHYYQRLVLMGWTHRRLAVAEYGLMLISGVVALLALRQPLSLQLPMLAALAVVYILVGFAVDRRLGSLRS